MSQPAPSPPANSGKRKPRQSADEIRLANSLVAQRKIQKLQERATHARKKEATKAAKAIVKAKEDAAKAAARIVWTKEASLELLGFVKMVQEEHREKSRQPGFTPYGKFFLAYTYCKEDFPLLARLDNETLLRRYRALMYQLRVSLSTRYNTYHL